MLDTLFLKLSEIFLGCAHFTRQLKYTLVSDSKLHLHQLPNLINPGTQRHILLLTILLESLNQIISLLHTHPNIFQSFFKPILFVR